MARLAGKVIIVTGAAQGMGEATAELFVSEGARVILTDVNATLGPAVATRLGERAQFSALDVTDADAWASLAGSVMAAHGRIDGLVNNAGVFFDALIEDTRLEAMRALIDVDLIGPWLGMRAVTPSMKAARTGSIINISSVEGINGHCGRTVYTAAKWGLRGMTKSLAKEVGPFGVRVNAINPGAIDTQMLRAGMAGIAFDSLFPEVAMGRPGRASEVAAASLFLMSDDSSYVSGMDLTVDGGWTCGTYTMNKPAVADRG